MVKKSLCISVLFIALFYITPSRAYEVLNGPSQLIQYNASKAYEGYTLITQGGDKKTYLIDMVGNVVHTWDHSPRDPRYHSILLDNGHLFGEYRVSREKVAEPFRKMGGWTGGLAELDWDGNVLWKFELNTKNEILHHDFVRLPNGNILSNAWEHISQEEAIRAGRREDQTTSAGVVADEILEINPAGKIVWKWRAWDHRGTKSKSLLDVNFITYTLPQYSSSNQDWTHFNDVAYDPATDRILVSSREFSEIYLIDHKTGDIIYRWGNPSAYGAGDPPTISTTGDQKLFGPHDAHFIPQGLPGAGHILIFNNGWGRTPLSFSSVIELDPRTGKVVWEYNSKNKTSFASSHISSAERLPNGNTFICSGECGHLFEVTSEGEVVWEYIVPLTDRGEKKNWIEDVGISLLDPETNSVFRAYRYGPDYPGLAGKDLTPQGQIAEDVKGGWQPQVDLTGATQPGVELWKKIWE